MSKSYRLSVNGTARAVTVESGTPLLYVLRNDFELNGPRFGCGLSQCGACTVLVEGKPVRSCVLPVDDAAGKKITTLEGLAPGRRAAPAAARAIRFPAAVAPARQCAPSARWRASSPD